MLKMRCNMCRYETIYWTGTYIEERKFKRNKRRVKRVMDAAAKRLGS